MSFKNRRKAQAEKNFKSSKLRNAAKFWQDVSRDFQYQYMFDWLGLPIIQDPQDICYLQEIIWETKPDVILECGIARGGSLILYTSLMNNYVNKNKKPFVIGIDIKIKKNNLKNIKKHKLGKFIKLIEGSSVDNKIFEKIKKLTDNMNILIILDSNHSESHVLEELKLYSTLLKKNNYIFVMDTGIEFADPSTFRTKRPWSKGNNPYTAVQKFFKIKSNKKFVIENKYEKRFILTSSPNGLIKRVV